MTAVGYAALVLMGAAEVILFVTVAVARRQARDAAVQAGIHHATAKAFHWALQRTERERAEAITQRDEAYRIVDQLMGVEK